MARTEEKAPATYLTTIREDLESAIFQIRMLDVFYGLGAMMMSAFGLLALLFFLDYLIPDLPSAVRVIGAGLGLIVLLYTAWETLIKPQLKTITARDIALSVERKYPQLEDRLISSLELVDALEESRPAVSGDLVRGLVEELREVYDQVNVRNILNPAPALKMFAGGLLCLAFAGGFVLRYPEVSQIYTSRLAGAEVEWPRATLLELNHPGDLTVVEENPIALEAVAKAESREKPRRAQLHIENEDGSRQTMRVEGESGEDGSVHYRFRRDSVTSPFHYYLVAGDGQTETGRVSLLERPSVSHLEVRYDYPDYTDLTDTPITDPEHTRDMSAPYGTEVDVRAQVEGNPQEVQALFVPDATGEETPLNAELQSDEAGENPGVETRFTMERDGSLFFRFQLEDSGEARRWHLGEDPFQVDSRSFSITVEVDNPPRIETVYPTGNKQVTPSGVVPLELTVTDDFGVEHIHLIRHINEGEETRVPFTSRHNDRPYGDREISSRYEMNFSELEVEPGDAVYYSYEAEDTGNVNDPVTTREYQFNVITQAELEQNLQDLQAEIRSEVENIRNNQQEQLQRIRETRNQLTSNPSSELSEEVRLALERARNRHLAMEQTMNQTLQKLNSVRKDALHNQLWDEQTREDLVSIYEQAEQIQSNQITAPARHLERTIEVTDHEKRVSSVEKSLSEAETTLSQLDNLLNNMGKWLDYADIIHEWQTIQESMEDIREEFLQ